MKNIYFVKKGVVEGPVRLEVILKRIRQGEIGILDKVFFEGEVRWQAAGDRDEFKEAFASLSAHEEKPWVLLTKNTADPKVPKEQRYQQSGPFSTETIRQRLHEGSVRFRDYVWKSGMKSWQRISSVAEFKEARPRLEMPSLPSSWRLPGLPEDTSENLLKNVLVKDLKRSEEPPPLEAEGRDLASAKPSPPKPVSPSAAEARGVREKRRPKPRAVQVKIEAAGNGKVNKYYFYLAILAVLALGSFGLWRKGLAPSTPAARNEHPTLKPSELSQSAQPILPPVAQPQQVVIASPEAQDAHAGAKPVSQTAPQAPHPATYLEIKGVGLTTKAAGFDFSTDASESYPIRVKIVAEAGSVLQKNSVYFKTTLRRKGEEPATISANQLKLPDGTYQVFAEVDSGDGEVIEASKTYFVGKRDSEFTKSLRAHKKSLTYYFAEERRRLWVTVRELKNREEELAKNFSKDASQWTPSYRKWQKSLQKISIPDPKSKNLLLPLTWQEVEEYRDSLRVKGQDFNKAALSQESKPALEALDKGLVRKAASLSLWREK